jgi:LysR family cyn operon transcriptional activator
MEIRNIRYFLAVAEEQSFRRAARRVGVSQPAVSQGIRLLEDQLGARLFDRGAARTALTPDGRLLLDPARRAVAEFDALSEMLDRSRGVVRGRLEIGTTDVASIYVLPPVYRLFRRKYPEADLSVHVEGTESLIRQLREATIEVAIITLAVGDQAADVPEGFTAEPLFREELSVIVARNHALARRRKIDLAELVDTPFISFKEGSVTRHAIDALFGENDVFPRVAMEMSSPEAIKKLVEVGVGASVLPTQSVRAEVRSGALVALPVRGARLTRMLGVVRARGRTPSPGAAAFLELVEKIRNVPREESVE